MAVLPRDRRHLIAGPPTNGVPYARPPRSIDSPPHPQRNRDAHAAHLLRRTGEAIAQGKAWLQSREPDVAEGEAGFYLAFSMRQEEAAFIDSVGDGTRKVELVAVQRPADGDTVLGTVFVPERSADYFSKKVEAYGNPDNDTRNADGQVTGHKNERLVSRVLDVVVGSARSIFTDEASDFPATNQRVWWEIWVLTGRVDRVRNVARKLGLDVRSQVLRFPERDIMLVFGSEDEINRLIRNTDGIAELRLASDTPALFIDMRPYEQPEWADDLAQRVEPPSAEAPFVTILDSGANRGHPLIALALAEEDQFTVEAAWGAGDSPHWSGHGTAMAGGVLYPDLEASLASTGDVELTHRLETVKILPHDGTGNDRRLYGAITEASVEQVEAANPERRRVFCMAVSSQFQIRRGRPSSWSAAVDKLAYEGEGPEAGRLFVVAAGNIGGEILANDYPPRNDMEPVESPGQAWNALVVGGYTHRTTLVDPDYAGWSTVAPVGALAPTTRTGVPWDREWANRPDIVFEAGNLAYDGTNPADPAPDLQLVTTHYQPQRRLFESFGDTSAAAAQAASLCGQLRASYPALRPETIRGLVVHSAEWTPHMAAEMDAARTEADRTYVLRRYGWGVPDKGRAMRSAANDATLIVEGQIVPYKDDTTLNELHLHRLPWPREELEDLGDVPVELRVTLSYFVEPNPAERGWTRRHRYASHALRFKVKQPSETEDQFHQRINASFDVDVVRSPNDDDRWLLKEGVRDRGSLHSDIWHGTAADLAGRDVMAVFPVGGWWKEKKRLRRCGRAVTYTLIISIGTEAEIDLYTAISNQIAIEVLAT